MSLITAKPNKSAHALRPVSIKVLLGWSVLLAFALFLLVTGFWVWRTTHNVGLAIPQIVEAGVILVTCLYKIQSNMSQLNNFGLAPSQVDENKVRVTAFGVLLLTIALLFTQWQPLAWFLSLDFALRSFNFGKYSPLGIVSGQITQLLKWEVKPIFYPPKRFAARIGLLFSLVLAGLLLVQLNIWAVGGVLAFFAGLESLLGICAGCYVYSWLSPLWNKSSKN